MSVVLGLMSGTSLDGLDLCCVRFAKNYKDFQILAAQTIPYSLAWKSKLENAFFGTTTEIDALDIEYGIFLAEQITDFTNTHSLPHIDLIAPTDTLFFINPKEESLNKLDQEKKLPNSPEFK